MGSLENRLLKYAAIVAVFIATFFSLIAFRSIPSARIWKSYRVIAVDVNCNEDFVISTLGREGAKGIISLSEQKIPAAEEKLPIFSLSLNSKINGNYLFERQNYFYDKSKSHKLYYVPEKYERAATDAVSFLLKNGIKASLDTEARFPWLAPIVCLIAFLFPLCLSSHKVIFLLACFFPILFPWSMPFYAAAVSSCLLFPLIFCAVELLHRRGSYKTLLRSPVIIFPVFAFIAAATVSLTAVFIFILCIASSMGLFVFLDIQLKVQGRRYTSLFIMPADVMFKTGKKFQPVFFVCLTDIIVLAICFLFSSHFLPSASSLELPSNNKNGEHALPGLNSYTAWHWNSETYPYRLITSDIYGEPEEGDTILFPRYVENDTMIIGHDDTMFVYDSSYRSDIVKAVDNFDFPAVEALLKAEGVYEHAGYEAGGKNSDSPKTIIVLIMSFIASTGAFFAYKIYSRSAAFFVNLR